MTEKERLTMRKIILLMIVFLLVTGGCALAAGPINPYFNEANVPAFMVYARSGKTIGIQVSADRYQARDELGKLYLPYDSCEDDGWWKASAWYEEIQYNEETGKDETVKVPGEFEFQFFVTVEEDGLPVTHGYRTYDAESEFSYDFVIPGRYTLWVYVRDDAGTSKYARYDVRVTDEDAVTEEEKIAELVQKCAEAGCESDYEKALWFHDWLINNARYDSSLSYYSSDGVLLRGTGVCDSYSKALVKLLNATGVDCTYYSSSEMYHSWNKVNMDGEWYFVDATWDDPVVSGSTAAVSGYENHIYFGLPEELLSFDHTFEPDGQCTAYESNYFIQTDKVSKWTAAPARQIQEDLDHGYYSFTLVPPEKYQNEYGILNTQDHGIVYGLSAYALSEQIWESGDQQYAIDVQYDWTKKKMSVALDFETAENTLFLPEALLRLGDGAFEDCDSVRNIRIPGTAVLQGENPWPENARMWTAKPE